ncbi:hypothetical protein [Altererythrobacter sp. MF3-039]|uniref:hypothetical protein n=1 Tax=Altererythrobacter sp. MF3-039 TaxID=3252901 RepID=UPI00390CC61E
MHSSYLLPRLKVAAFVAALGLLTQFGQHSAAELSGVIQSTISTVSAGPEPQAVILLTFQISVPPSDAPSSQIE